MPDIPTRPSRIGLDSFYLYIGIATVVNGFIITRETRGWILGDWLINYEGGFVRRGLSGEAAFLLARLLNTSPAFIAVTFYLTLYAVFFLAFRDIATKAAKDLWIYALILSPAALSFQVLQRSSGFRKEVIYLAALAVFAVLLKKNRLTSTTSIAYLSCVLIVSTLCHEGLIFYSPYFVAALLISGRSAGQTIRACAVPFLCGAVAFAFCYNHLGNAAIASQICSSIGYKLQANPGSTDICVSGAIPYLVKTRAIAAQETLAKILNYDYFGIFPYYFLLALLPAVGESVTLIRLGMRREVRILWVTFAISFVATLILFRYAVDWGRWIYIHIASLTVLLLFIEGKRKATALHRHGGMIETVSTPAVDPPATRRVLQWAFVIVYATCWTLPGDTETLRMGYAGLVLETLHITSKSPNEERIPAHATAAAQ